MQFKKEYSIEWEEECEADSFEEAEKILDKQAEECPECYEVLKHADVEKIGD